MHTRRAFYRPRHAIIYYNVSQNVCKYSTYMFVSRGFIPTDILKHTNKNNPDHSALVAALAGLREVMSHINEDKRKTEGQLQMFDIYNDIDQCPVTISQTSPHLTSRVKNIRARQKIMSLNSIWRTPQGNVFLSTIMIWVIKLKDLRRTKKSRKLLIVKKTAFI